MRAQFPKGDKRANCVDLTLVVDELYRYPEAMAQAQRATTVLSDFENDYRRNKVETPLSLLS